jgi:hypothetical protein
MLRDIAWLEAVPLERVREFSVFEFFDFPAAAGWAVAYWIKNHPVVSHEKSLEKISHVISFSKG